MRIEEKMGFPDSQGISDKAIVFTDNKNVENNLMRIKLYFHMMEKHFNLPFLSMQENFSFL
jgi:hypothetical protein